MERYEIYDVETEELLACCHDLVEAEAVAERYAEHVAALIEEQLAANGEGHPGGIEVRLAVHDSHTDELLLVARTWTAAVCPRLG